LELRAAVRSAAIEANVSSISIVAIITTML